MFKRNIYHEIVTRLRGERHFIQVLAGPRQTGKTTLARQTVDTWKKRKRPCHYASADEPALKDRAWLEQQWETARTTVQTGRSKAGLLILDEIQKIPGWSETVKRLWDEDTFNQTPLQVMVLGSSPLMVQRGLTDSLAGRFELIPVTHWSLPEMQKAFGWTVDQYIYYGGYPGAAPLIDDHQRWVRYIKDSLIETTISRDVLLMTQVNKPALLRRLFELGCAYSGRVLSYQKMTGQLQEAGNTTTLAHYLDLLHGAGLMLGLQKFAGQQVRRRASSPKLQVLNTALMSAMSGLDPEEFKAAPEQWGRLVESAVGATIVNGSIGTDIEVYYWSHCNREVDFVLSRGKKLVAIEVKTGRRLSGLPGIEAFSKRFKVTRKLLVGQSGIPLENFLTMPLEHWLG